MNKYIWSLTHSVAIIQHQKLTFRLCHQAFTNKHHYFPVTYLHGAIKRLKCICVNYIFPENVKTLLLLSFTSDAINHHKLSIFTLLSRILTFIHMPKAKGYYFLHPSNPSIHQCVHLPGRPKPYITETNEPNRIS